MLSKKKYNLNIFQKGKENLKIPNYTIAPDGKYYKYNYLIGGVYYCTNNIIIDGDKIVTDYKQKQERYLIIDYFILDLQEKRLKLYDETIRDSFINDFNNCDKIKITKFGDNKIITIDDILELIIDKENRIISYSNKKNKYVDDMYLYRNLYLENISLEDVEYVGEFFLNTNIVLNKIYIPRLKEKGEYFLYSNPIRNEININSEEKLI